MSNFLGNTEIKKELARGNFAHAYLLCGEPGCGKKTLARRMAALIVEDHSGKVERGEHLDVLWLAPREAGKQISVDEIRAFRREAYVLPHEAPRKVLIIDRCESLNESGQNAILKILEEPPKSVVFILLAPSREALLPTIRSRTVIWDLQPVPPAEGIPFLKERFSAETEERIAAALRAADGNLGRAAAYLEGGTFITYGEVGVRLLGKLCRGKGLESEQTLAGLPKGDFPFFLESFTRLSRDFLLYKTGSGAEKLVFSESILKIKGFLDRIKLEQFYKMARLSLECETMLSNYGNENLIKAYFIAEMGELLR